MARIQVNTSVSLEQHKMIKENNWKWSEVIRNGIGAMTKPDVLIERVTALENELNAMRLRMDRYKKVVNEELAKQ